MKINRDLNLVLTVDRDAGSPAQIHSTPISAAVFEQYFLTISSTYAAMVERGPTWVMQMGPRTALMMLKRVAEADKVWEGPEGIEKGLLNEIWRLTNVLTPTETGWEMLPFEDAVRRKYLTEEDVATAKNAICFFSVVYAAIQPRAREASISAIFGLFGALVTSSNATDYMSSLPMPTQAVAIGEKARASSIPR